MGKQQNRAFLPRLLLTLLALSLYIAESHARSGSAFGPVVDNACGEFNGTAPFADQGCALCHAGSNFGTRVDPEWGWWETGNLTAFCPEVVNQAPNGIIDTPTTDQTINIGDSVRFTGTSSDPDNNLPLTFNWDFDAGTPNSNAEDPGSLTFNSAGTYTVTFTVTDSLGLRDPTPDSITITVNDPTPTCTDADNDGFALEGGNCGVIDCDDNNAAINPDAPEICTDGIDNNCNSLVDAADPDAVNCPVDACFDNDGDQYSPEGWFCGPIDCDDFDAAVNPGAVEACGDGIDNDCDGALDREDRECNGGDCLSQLFGGGNIDVEVEAEWSSKHNRLEVEGEYFPAGAVVEIYDADTNALLGMAEAGSDGKGRFKLIVANPETVPCNILVLIVGSNLQFEERVEDAPGGCGGNSHVEIETKWSHKKNRLEVKGKGFPAGAVVKIFNADTSALLGTADISRDGEGRLRFKLTNPETVPCNIRVQIAGTDQQFEEKVEDAPGDCENVDLSIANLTTTTDRIESGKRIRYSVEVINKGNAVAGANYLRLVLSSDAVIDGNDRRLSRPSKRVPKLASGARHRIKSAVRIPKDVVSGSYFLGVIVDPKNKISESREANNTDGVAITVTTSLK